MNKIRRIWRSCLKEMNARGYRLKIINEPKPKPRVKKIIASAYNKTVKIYSWAKHYDDKQLKAILIHEICHLQIPNPNMHNFGWAALLVMHYKKLWPNSFKSLLRGQWWLIGESEYVNGLTQAKKYGLV